ncbi:MAG: type IV pilus biogenesis/stability protein PilW [Pseudomonadales bacterium]
MMRRCSAALVLLLLAGCVTESTGGRVPAPKEVQLRAHLDLARGYLEQGDLARSRDPLERALQIDPRSPEALTLNGFFYQRQNEPELAERHYRRALQIDSRHALTLNNYGTFLFTQGRYDEALVLLRRLAQDPEYRERAQAFENLGLTELRVGNSAQAKSAFERALSFNGRLPRSHLELAQLAFAAGDHATADSHYEAFRSLARQTPASLCLGIRLAQAAGDDNSRASYEIALKNLHPDSAEAARCINEG